MANDAAKVGLLGLGALTVYALSQGGAGQAARSARGRRWESWQGPSMTAQEARAYLTSSKGAGYSPRVVDRGGEGNYWFYADKWRRGPQEDWVGPTTLYEKYRRMADFEMEYGVKLRDGSEGQLDGAKAQEAWLALADAIPKGERARGRRALPQVRAPRIVSVHPQRYGFSTKYRVAYSDGSQRWAYKYDPRFKPYMIAGEAGRGRRADLMGGIPVWQEGKWKIKEVEVDTSHGGPQRRILVLNEKTGFTDYPVWSDWNDQVAWDHVPPKYVQDATLEAFHRQRGWGEEAEICQMEAELYSPWRTR